MVYVKFNEYVTDSIKHSICASYYTFTKTSWIVLVKV